MAKELQFHLKLFLSFNFLTMKKILALLAITGFVACGGGNEDASGTTTDSLDRASDSVMQMGDTSEMNGVMGDSTSAGVSQDTLQ